MTPRPETTCFTVPKYTLIRWETIYWELFNWMTRWKKYRPTTVFVVTINGDSTLLQVLALAERDTLLPDHHVLFVGTAPDSTIQQTDRYMKLMRDP